MKRSLLILLTSIIFAKTNGQITKGNWLVGGTGSLVSEKTSNSFENRKRVQLILSPNIGYYFIDKLCIGLKPEFEFEKIENLNQQYYPTSQTSKVSVGPFLRYYIFPTDRLINFLVHGDALVGKYHFSQDNQPSQEQFFYSWAVNGGPVVFLNSSVALEATGGYKSFKLNNTDQISRTFQFSIGLQVHLEKLE